MEWNFTLILIKGNENSAEIYMSKDASCFYCKRVSPLVLGSTNRAHLLGEEAQVRLNISAKM
jgi:hypothetical protein